MKTIRKFNVMKRKQAREYAVLKAFEIDANHDWEGDISRYLGDEDLGKQRAYVTEVLGKVSGERDKIDSLINQISDGWTTGRMAKTDLAIIRVAVAEMLYVEDVPKAVAINEAVELAKTYGTDDSRKFINAILGKINV